MAWSQPSAKSLSIFSGDHRVGLTVGFLFVLVGGGGGQKKGEKKGETSCSQNSLSWEQCKKECTSWASHLSTSVFPKGDIERENKLGSSLLWFIKKSPLFPLFQESYVWKMYQERCWDFFPAGDCFRKQYEDQLG